MSTLDDLRTLLESLEGGGYGGYKRARGLWSGRSCDVAIDHVQGDPFAAPSVIRLVVREHGHHAEHLRPGIGQVALCDLLLRRFARAVQRIERRGSGKSGAVDVDQGTASILARSGCAIVDGQIELRFRVGLPARGRRVMGRAAADLLTQALPAASDAVRADRVDLEDIHHWRRSALEHEALTEQLEAAGLVAFIADGSILPRASGVDDGPLRGAVPMRSPPSLRVELRGLDDSISGLGIPQGVTLVAGAGFHGKSTLLQAVAEGVYPRVPGDGRERVATVRSAMKVRSEDGRAVTGVDVRPFIAELPGGRSTESFSTADASGSTSLAASILESIDAGSTTLLFDEDTCATNLLVRDARMQALIERDTIVPLVDRVQQLHDERGVSSVLVVGGSGDYLDVADTVIAMDEYLPRDVTDAARRVVDSLPSRRRSSPAHSGWTAAARAPEPASIAPTRGAGTRGKVRARGLRDLDYGDDTIALDGLEQLVDASQVRTLGLLLEWVGRQAPGASIGQLARAAVEHASSSGLYAVRASPELAAVRPEEVAAAINRLRALRLTDHLRR